MNHLKYGVFFFLVVLTGACQAPSLAKPDNGFDVQMYVDTSASAVRWTAEDDIWRQSMVNLVDRLKGKDRLKAYTFGKQLSAVSAWIEKPSVGNFEPLLPSLFPARANGDQGTCTREVLKKAAANLELTSGSGRRNLLILMLDADEGAKGCPKLSESEWSEWFARTTNAANIMIFPLDTNNRFATFLDDASAAQARSVAICRKSAEPQCHLDRLRDWRKQ